MENTQEYEYQFKTHLGLISVEKSSPLIFEAIRRWRYLLWDDYVDYKSEKQGRKKLLIP
jgi:hypothetical protein